MITGTAVPVISGAELTPKNRRLKEGLEHRLNRWFQEQANNVAEALHKKYNPRTKKADHDTNEDTDAEGDDLQTELLVGGKKIPKVQSDLIRALSLMAWGSIKWDTLVELFRPYLEGAGTEGVNVGVGQVQMPNAGRAQDKAEADVEQIAKDRAAALAGMKWTAADALAIDLEAHWPLTDVFRRDIENSITQAVIEGWTDEQLSAVIEASYAFSAERAAVVADTEVTNAQSGGTYSLWRQSGTVTLVHWVTSDLEREPDECDGYAAQGIVPLGHEFDIGLFAPRAHPNCRCSLEVVDPADLPLDGAES